MLADQYLYIMTMNNAEKKLIFNVKDNFNFQKIHRKKTEFLIAKKTKPTCLGTKEKETK